MPSMPIDSLEIETSCYIVHGSKFVCEKRYSILKAVGHGAYGMVCAASDAETGEQIAIKKIENAFEHITFTKRALRELRILRHLRHENLLEIKSIFLPGRRDQFDDVYVISELMEIDLGSILRSPQTLTEEHCQFFVYQILRGMKYVHSAEVIHGDLKPRNLLVNANCDLKIGDFSLARVSFPESEYWACPMTEHVCTRWYRAPEVICCWSNYTSAIDLWSIGCILAEMINRHHLFPGQNTQHQLRLIVELLGTPSAGELQRLPNVKCRKFIESLPFTEDADFGGRFKDASPQALDFLRCTVAFCPTKRLTVAEVVRLDYVSALYCPEDEPTRAPLDLAEFEFERRRVTFKTLRHELFEEALNYYPALKRRYEEEEGRNRGPSLRASSCPLLVVGEELNGSDEDPKDD